MRHQFAGELDSCGRDGRVGRGSSEQLLAAGSNRGRLPSRSARVCEMRQKTKDDRRLSAVRLIFCRRNRHRRHLDEQRESALVGGQPSRAGPSPASTGRAAAAGPEAHMAADQLIRTLTLFLC